MIKNEDEKAGNEAAEVRRTQLIKPAHMVVMEGVVVLHHCFTTVLRANSPRRRFDDNSVGRMDRISKIDLTTPLSLSLSLSSLFSLQTNQIHNAKKTHLMVLQLPFTSRLDYRSSFSGAFSTFLALDCDL